MEHTPIIKFLLVDDTEANLLALEQLLKRPGLELLKARSGPEALELLLAHEVGLALLDVQMPGMDGFELARLMRGTDRTRLVPIIFVTAGAADQRRRFDGYGAGAVDFLHKPIEELVLKGKANVFFDLALQRSQLRESEQRSARTQVELEHTVLELEAARQAALAGMEEAVEARNAQERLNLALRESEEALREADRRKDEFLATLAHELRNPLAPIRSGLQVLQELGDDEADHEAVRAMMQRQVDQMVHLLEDLLDLSRVSRGVIELRQRSMDVNEAIQQAMEANRPLVEQKRHQLVASLSASPITVKADPTRLAQIFGNLLDNAGKYTDDGGAITISSKSVDGEVHVSIADSGIGIRGEDLGKVFDMFGQVDRSNARTRGGLGIGLHIVQQLVEMHGGRIEVTSEGLGKGSVFTVALPVLDELPPGDRDARLPSNAKASRILIADDNADAALSLSLLLKRSGHTVEVAQNGEQALELGGLFRPEVIILDIGMPGMDGYETCRRIRKEPWGSNAFLIALTGWGQDKDVARSQEVGFDRHLVKPTSASALSEVLAKRLQ